MELVKNNNNKLIKKDNERCYQRGREYFERAVDIEDELLDMDVVRFTKIYQRNYLYKMAAKAFQAGSDLDDLRATKELIKHYKHGLGVKKDSRMLANLRYRVAEIKDSIKSLESDTVNVLEF